MYKWKTCNNRNFNKRCRLEINSKDINDWTPFHSACYKENTKIISLFLNSNRKIELDIQSIQEYFGYPVGTSAYDILKRKNINIDVVKEKISKNQKLLFLASNGNLSKLNKLVQIKKFKIIF